MDIYLSCIKANRKVDGEDSKMFTDSAIATPYGAQSAVSAMTHTDKTAPELHASLFPCKGYSYRVIGEPAAQ